MVHTYISNITHTHTQVMDDSRKLAHMQREWADREEDIRRHHAAEISRLREQVHTHMHVFFFLDKVLAVFIYRVSHVWNRVS